MLVFITNNKNINNLKFLRILINKLVIERDNKVIFYMHKFCKNFL